MRLTIHIFLFFILIVAQPLPAKKKFQLDSLLSNTRTAKDTALVNTYLALADIYKHLNHDSALLYIVKAENEAQKIDYTNGYCDALLIHGNVLYFKNDYSGALDYFTKSLDRAEAIKNKLLKAKCLERLASLHLMTDNPNRAFDLYFKSRVLFEELSYKPGMAKVYNILGVYHGEMGRLDTALAYLKKSMDINREINNTYNLIQNHVNLGYIYEMNGAPEKAQKIYYESIPLIEETGEKPALMVVYFNLASIHQKRNEDHMALQLIGKSITIAEQLNDTAMLSSLYGNAGQLLLEQKQWQEAEDILNKSLLCSRVINDVETEIKALEFIAVIDSTRGDYTAGFSNLKRIISLKDTLHQQQLDHHIQEAELQYANLKQKEQIELQEKKIRNDRFIKTLFIVLFFLALITVFLLVRLMQTQKKSQAKGKALQDNQIKIKQLELEKIQQDEYQQRIEKERVEEVLRLKERELFSLALQMELYCQNINFLQDKLKQLSEQSKITPKDIENLDKEMKIKFKDFDNWELFYRSFNEIHKDFLKSLKEKHPDLTTTEIKHCAYIRIHLSTSQMATLLNITVDSIRKTRYRIRKKLNLQSGESLENYLLKF